MGDLIRHLKMQIKLFLKKYNSTWIVQNLVSIIVLIIILCIGSYYRILAMDSNILIRNGFESSVSMASYLFVNPAKYSQGSLVKEEYSIYDSFPLKEYSKYTDGADSFTFVRNPDKNSIQEKDFSVSRSELGWAFILRYVLPDGIKGSQNMAMRIVRFCFVIELILIILLFFIGKKVAGILGAILAALLYAIFLPAVHMMSYVTYYYWTIPFSVFSLFFWIVLYEGLDNKENLKKKIMLFFFYGTVMGFGAATRMVLLLLPLFLSPFILYKERKIKIAIILLIVMLSGQFLLLVPQMIVNKKQFGRFAISTRETWHTVLMGLGFRKNPFGIENSGDFAIFNYIKRETGVLSSDSDAYNKASKRQVIKLVKENPGLFINNAIENIKSAKFINPTAFYGIDTPLNKATSLEDIQKNGPGSLVSAPLIKKYFLWLVLLALIIMFFNSQKQFRMFLLLIAQNIYLVLIICLYFPNYLYFMSGYIPSWILLFSLSLSIIMGKLLSHIKLFSLAGFHMVKKDRD